VVGLTAVEAAFLWQNWPIIWLNASTTVVRAQLEVAVPTTRMLRS
jgi:hypothetical protein